MQVLFIPSAPAFWFCCRICIELKFWCVLTRSYWFDVGAGGICLGFFLLDLLPTLLCPKPPVIESPGIPKLPHYLSDLAQTATGVCRATAGAVLSWWVAWDTMVLLLRMDTTTVFIFSGSFQPKLKRWLMHQRPLGKAEATALKWQNNMVLHRNNTVLTAVLHLPCTPHACPFRCCFENEKGAANRACPSCSQFCGLLLNREMG